MMSLFSNHLGRAAALNLLGMVVLGAVGGHNHNWQDRRKERFRTAQLYHLVSGVGMFMGRFATVQWVRLLIGACHLGGLAMFVGPLYYMVFKDEENFPLRKAMPLGGVAMMVGFLVTAVL